jgi:hypothetical protein
MRSTVRQRGNFAKPRGHGGFDNLDNTACKSFVRQFSNVLHRSNGVRRILRGGITSNSSIDEATSSASAVHSAVFSNTHRDNRCRRYRKPD